MRIFLRGVVGLIIIALVTALGLFGGCTVGFFGANGNADKFQLYVNIGALLGAVIGIFLVWRLAKYDRN